ncbi:C40 family peptidase [Pseudoflavitalea rhizosphaerae]|uniref:C40 family peptidase n=1 Tax=Pseudoflavitalea rhizosphaerae TaxID=1884793 RepID=UPI000F8E210B|nr:NlpC/P60 family protein [Pseudoflavitalea rhizosphaerae]
MSYIVKNALLVATIALGATSCNTFKRSTSSSPAGGSTAANAKTAHPPKFIENISINSNDFKGRHGESGYMPTLIAPASNMEGVAPMAFKYAILLDVPVESITDGKLFDFIESWYGTKYRYGGNDRSGIDCSAFSQNFISSLYNVGVPRTSASQYENSKRISKSELQEGDLVFFKTSRKKAISHVGVYLRNNKFVHASTSSGVVINDLNDVYYVRTFAGCGRVR